MSFSCVVRLKNSPAAQTHTSPRYLNEIPPLNSFVSTTSHNNVVQDRALQGPVSRRPAGKNIHNFAFSYKSKTLSFIDTTCTHVCARSQVVDSPSVHSEACDVRQIPQGEHFGDAPPGADEHRSSRVPRVRLVTEARDWLLAVQCTDSPGGIVSTLEHC